jgi:DnaK suppressor protein
MTGSEKDVHHQQERRALLRQMLEDRRGEIQGKLRSILDTLPDEKSSVRDAEEQSVSDFVEEVDFTLMQMKSETLAKIDEALHRLAEGTYGRCLDCGKEIPGARLVALPFAARCRDCQERQEEAAAGYDVREATPALGSKLRDALALSPDKEATHE